MTVQQGIQQWATVSLNWLEVLFERILSQKATLRHKEKIRDAKMVHITLLASPLPHSKDISSLSKDAVEFKIPQLQWGYKTPTHTHKDLLDEISDKPSKLKSHMHCTLQPRWLLLSWEKPTVLLGFSAQLWPCFPARSFHLCFNAISHCAERWKTLQLLLKGAVVLRENSVYHLWIEHRTAHSKRTDIEPKCIHFYRMRQMDSFSNSVSYSNQALCFNSETPALVITNNTGKTGLILKDTKLWQSQGMLSLPSLYFAICDAIQGYTDTNHFCH